MTIGELLAGRASVSEAVAGLELAGLTADSRQVRPGWLFVALPRLDRAGFKFDGHEFVAQAVAQGAVAVLATRPVEATVPVVVVPDTRAVLGPLAARWYGEPSATFPLVGVTGTNGKTTITYLLEAIFARLGWSTVVAGTVETRLAGERRPATTTTPDPVTLQALWREAVDRGVRAGAMECSSHALHQHRVAGTRFAVAVFTNLTQDHLDYHADMDEYFEAKASLFAPDSSGHAPVAVVNVDDPAGVRLLERPLRQPWSYGLSAGATVRAVDVVYGPTGSTFTVEAPGARWHQSLCILGHYNVSNALAAIATALALGLAPAVIAAALSECHGAPGRVEAVAAGQDFTVLVDYAHTPDALAQVLAALRPVTRGRLLTVFGCGGDRDRTKRPLMGRIAAAASDLVVVTSDNPRTEQPQAILDDILAGLDSREHVLVEVDRQAAIEQALGLARAGDVVLIAGKGHEDYQLLGTTKVHFDDREVARAWLEGRR